MNVPVVQSKAWCPSCWTHLDPSSLVQTWRASDELACPDCRSPIPDEYQPETL